MTARCVFRQELDGRQLEVWDEGRKRSLWFDDQVLQTEIDRRDPKRLPNPANRAMLAHLLFGPVPRRVLLGGCGGGGIARWFHARAPEIRGEAAEISATVAGVARDWFDFPGTTSRWRLRQTDVRDLLHQTDQTYDFVLFDLEENQQTPDWLTTPEFLDACRRRLRRSGVLTLNLIAEDATRFAGALATIRQRFDRRVLCLPVPGHHNIIVLGFMAPPALDDLDGRARQAEARWGIEFPRLLQRLRRANPPGSGVF